MTRGALSVKPYLRVSDFTTTNPLTVSISFVLPFVGLPVEVKSRLMLEFQAALQPICPAANDNVGSHKADDLEILGELLGVPDFAKLGFKGLTAAGLCVYFGQALTTKGFGGVGHGWLPR